MQNKSKTIRFPLGIIEEIEDVQERKHFPNFAQTVMYLVRASLEKVNAPHRNKRPPKTAAEKLLEKKEAEKLAEKIEREEELAIAKALDGLVCDRDGNPDSDGTYVEYKKYALLPGGGDPYRIFIVQERNPIWYSEDMIERQYEGGTKEEIQELIRTGNYVESK